jgi:hypothetical protein
MLGGQMIDLRKCVFQTSSTQRQGYVEPVEEEVTTCPQITADELVVKTRRAI